MKYRRKKLRKTGYLNSNHHFNIKKGGKKKSKKKSKGFFRKIVKYIYKIIFYFKNIINCYFGYLLVLIPILCIVIYSLYNRTENFFNFFNKDLNRFPDRKVNYINDTGEKNLQKENIITKNNSIQDTTYTPSIDNQSKLPPSKKGPMRIASQNEETLEKIRKPEQSFQPVGQALFGTLQCKVLSECSDGYYNTGAEFNGVKCQNDSDSRVAKAVASIKNGYIDNIYLVDKGLGYKETPKIKILGGNGMDAHATCMIHKNSVNKIELQNRGRNYNSTPKIIIEAPKTNHTCKLCCKK